MEINNSYTGNDVNMLYLLIGKSIWNLQNLEFILTIFTTMRELQKKRNENIIITEKLANEDLESIWQLTLRPSH